MLVKLLYDVKYILVLRSYYCLLWGLLPPVVEPTAAYCKWWVSPSIGLIPVTANRYEAHQMH